MSGFYRIGSKIACLQLFSSLLNVHLFGVYCMNKVIIIILLHDLISFFDRHVYITIR